MDAQTLNCPGCGHPAEPNALHCGYCQAALQTVACPACFGLLFLGSPFCSHCGAKAVRPQPRAESGPCPRCGVTLVTYAVGDFVLYECGGCGGVWLDPPSFRDICASREKQAMLVPDLPGARPAATDPTLQAVVYLPCPRCRQPMNRMNFGGTSGIIIDTCRDHGVWLDRDELRGAIEFIRGGGLEREREAKIEELRAERRRLEQESASGSVAAPLDLEPIRPSLPGELLRVFLSRL